MTFTELNATRYEHNGVFYTAEFEELLSKTIACYDLMLADKVILTNDENLIRDVLLINYLKNNKIRKKINLIDYLFDREVPEDRTKGRTDIKIQTTNTFRDTDAYYTIECKRLDALNPNGTTGLNAKYIENGINRFISNTYRSHYKTNGLIGFIVEAMDIDQNIASINQLLKTTYTAIKTIQELEYKRIIENFNQSYSSIHDLEGDNLILYHLMFDFSKNMQN